MAGRLPNLITAPVFGLKSDSLPATTLVVAASPLAGGFRYRHSG